MSSGNRHTIFVYGTLKKDWGNHRIIADQQYLGCAETSHSNFQMYSLGGFPGVVAGDKVITGELYSVDDEAFARCDRLEGHPSFYKREQISVSPFEGENVIAWIYIYQGQVSDLQPIEVW